MKCYYVIESDAERTFSGWMVNKFSTRNGNCEVKWRSRSFSSKPSWTFV